ncbi:MAG: hypothetical protein OEV94_06960 [Deltaproteobacteria bacterium]|nr:hypothetical protein [Deltaproteobacteria bacterium]
MKKKIFPIHIIVLSAVLVFLLSVGLHEVYFLHLSAPSYILPPVLREYEMQNSQGQSLLYFSWVFVLALISAGILFFPKQKWIRGSGNSTYPLFVFFALLISVILFSSVDLGFIGGIVLFYALRRLFQSPAFSLWVRTAGKKISSNFYIGVIGLWGAIGIGLIVFVQYYIVPIGKPLIMNSAAYMASVQFHYTATIFPGVDLTCCEDSRSFYNFAYGFWMPMAGYVSMHVLPGVGAAPFFMGVKIASIISLGVIGVGIYLLNRRYWLFLLAMVAVYFHNVGPGLHFPNQTGLRYFPFLLGVVVLAFEMKRPYTRTWMLGGLGGICLILSPETSLALMAGLLVSALIRNHKKERPFVHALKTTGEFILSAGAVFCAVSFTILAIFSKYRLDATLMPFKSITGSYAGLIEITNYKVIVFAFFASLSVFRGCWRASQGVANWRDAYQAGVGTSILVWLSYYMNRMSEMNLWFLLVLLILLFSPRVNWAAWRFMMTKSFGTGHVYLLLAMGGVLYFTYDEINHSRSMYHLQNGNLPCYDTQGAYPEYCLLGDSGKDFSEKMNELGTITNKADVLILSGYSMEVRLQGFNAGFPWYDPFGEVGTYSRFDHCIGDVSSRNPVWILSENPNTEAGKSMPNRMEHQRLIMQALPQYQEIKRSAHWIYFQRKGS